MSENNRNYHNGRDDRDRINDEGTSRHSSQQNNHNRRRRKRKYNPFLEWLSDYLPYLIIAAIIIVVIVVVALIVRSVKNNNSGETVQTTSQQTVEAAADSTESVNQDTQSTSSTSSGSDSTAVTAADSTLDIDSSTIQLDQADDTISSVVQSYFDSLLSSQANPAIESYSGLTTYVYPVGNDTIAFVEYTYKYRDFEENIPALTELYISDGQVVNDLTSEQDAAMTEAASSSEAASLVSQVQSAYDSVIASDSALESYISSLTGEDTGSTDTSDSSVTSSSVTSSSAAEG
ncbi:MAG: hypothetical protein SOI56_06545 [Eubacteriales bacterium]|jgi:hypothetical protein